MRYIAFLRGINVGGHNVKMEDMRQLFTELGFKHVRSYIQTGNIFFETDALPDRKLEEKIEAHLYTELGYAVPTFVRTIDEVEAILRDAPFNRIELTDDTRHVIMFLSEDWPPDISLPFVSEKSDFELLQAGPHTLYVLWRIINGRPTSSLEPFLKKHVPDIKTTSRFFHTAEKILAAAIAPAA